MPDYTRLVDTRHHQQSKGIGTSSCLASPLCTITTSWPTSPWRRKLESFSRDLEIAEGTLPKWRKSGAKPEDCPRLGLFTHPSTLGGFYPEIQTGLFTDVSKQGLSLPSKSELTPHQPLTPPDTQQTAIGHKLQWCWDNINYKCFWYCNENPFLSACLNHLRTLVSYGWSVMQILNTGFGLPGVWLWPLALSWQRHPSTMCTSNFIVFFLEYQIDYKS